MTKQDKLISVSSILSEFEFEIIRLRFVDKLTLEEIATEVDCSRLTVIRYIKQSIRRMRQYRNLVIDF